jgi:hypothetical protein
VDLADHWHSGDHPADGRDRKTAAKIVPYDVYIKKCLNSAVITLLLFAGTASTLGQQTAPEMRPGNGQTSAMDSPHIREMAEAMTDMARACQQMMEMEMGSRPLKLWAGVTVGVLLLIALILFIILEVQWIRFWSVRIKTERARLHP